MKREQHALMLAGLLLSVCNTMAATVVQPTQGSATITIPVTIINQQNTCRVELKGDAISGGSYRLDPLQKGELHSHPSFQAMMYCDGDVPVKTALKVQPGYGFTVTANNRVAMRGASQDVKGELWLTLPGGNLVSMRGDTAFCPGMSTRTQPNSCVLKPVTQILSAGPGGEVNAILTFNVDYS